jgi:proteasome lid subunit RPN8/RPN11
VNLTFKLKKFLTGDKERVGFVLKTGQIVEVPNVCAEPEKGFLVRAEDLLKYEGKIAATWHTHPQGTAVLSVGDYDSFKNWPEWRHYIIGTDGVTEYYVDEDGELMIA